MSNPLAGYPMPFLVDGGLETTLIFLEGLDLPEFAALTLVGDDAGRATLRRYHERYLAIAAKRGLGYILDTPTWRGGADWATPLGYERDAWQDLQRLAVVDAVALKREYNSEQLPVLVAGSIGPRGDGYVDDSIMTTEAAQAYHDQQISVLAGAGVEMISAMTLNNAPEAIGIANSCRANNVPAILAFTVETDGRLPSGQALGEAIVEVDEATGASAAFFMINCAHPSHFENVLHDEPWLARIGGLRANASRMSHEELDNAPDLDRGCPTTLAADYGRLLHRLPHSRLFGGCCGTDHEHIDAIAQTVWAKLAA